MERKKYFIALARRLLCRGQSLRGLHPLAMPSLATDSKGSNLAAAAVLVAFRIGPFRNFQHKFTISYSNHGPNLLSWRYKQFAKLEFDGRNKNDSPGETYMG